MDPSKLIDTYRNTEIKFEICKVEDLELDKLTKFTIGPNVFDDKDETRDVIVIKTFSNKSINEPKIFAIPFQCAFCNWTLEKGFVQDNIIRCSLHGSGYDLETGELLDGPGFDNLSVYKVVTEDNQVCIVASIGELRQRKKEPFTLQKWENSTENGVAIIGSGPDAVRCIETLRKESYTYPITLISKEDTLPYHTHHLPSYYLTNVEEIHIRPMEFYKNLNVEVLLNTNVISIDFEKKIITLDTDPEKPRKYQQLVLAMGSEKKKLQVPGSDLKGIYYLNTWKDAYDITMASFEQDPPIDQWAIIGSSFECYELASAYFYNISSTDIIDPSEAPLKMLGSTFSKELPEYLKTRNITLHTNKTVESFEGDEEDRISKVKLNDGSILECNLAVVFIGLEPRTSFLNPGQIKMDENGHIFVNKFMETSQSDVYAIGDITKFPIWQNTSGKTCEGEKYISLSYWSMAQTQGKITARAIMGKKCNRKLVPMTICEFVGIDPYETFCGDPTIEYDSEITRGTDINNRITYFLKNDEVVAVSNNYYNSNQAVQFLEIFQRGIKVTRGDVEKNETNDWSEVMKRGDETLYDKE